MNFKVEWLIQVLQKQKYNFLICNSANLAEKEKKDDIPARNAIQKFNQTINIKLKHLIGSKQSSYYGLQLHFGQTRLVLQHST